jgi:hypothetical protein
MSILPPDNWTGDCQVLSRLWEFVWDQGSGPLYLPNLLTNGLAKFNLQPLTSVAIDDIDNVLFNGGDYGHPALGGVELNLTGLTVSGLGTIANQMPAKITCDNSAGTSTSFSVSVVFTALEIAGNFAVTASDLSGCALTTASSFMNVPPTLAAAPGALGATPADDVQLALYFRDGPLTQSANGNQLNQLYYTHQDTIGMLLNEPGGNLFTQRLQQPDVATTAQAVRAATSDYRDQAPTPATIGTPDQYNTGFDTNNQLAYVASVKVQNDQDPDGRFAALVQDQLNFYLQVAAVQNDYPDRQTAGDILGIVASAPDQPAPPAAGHFVDPVGRRSFPHGTMPIYAPNGDLFASVTRQAGLVFHTTAPAASGPSAAPSTTPAPVPTIPTFYCSGDVAVTITNAVPEVTAHLNYASDGSMTIGIDSISLDSDSTGIVLSNIDGGGDPLFPDARDAVEKFVTNLFFRGLVNNKIASGINDKKGDLENLANGLLAKLP